MSASLLADAINHLLRKKDVCETIRLGIPSPPLGPRSEIAKPVLGLLTDGANPSKR